MATKNQQSEIATIASTVLHKKIADLEEHHALCLRQAIEQEKHVATTTRCWIETLLHRAVFHEEQNGEDGVEIDFSSASSQVVVTKEFGGRDSCALRSLVKDQVVPYWVDYLLQLEASGEGDGDEFKILGDDYYVDCVHISGEQFSHVEGKYKMVVKVDFKMVQMEECVVCGETYPVSQMVTDGEGTYMLRELHENFE